MAYLIDGYNLLHAIGALPDRAGPTGLAKARARLLGLLHGAIGSAADVTVVFDAAGAPPGAPESAVCQGIRVRYAVHGEADDVIEALIAAEGAPRQLVVVSDDHRVRDAARGRQCQAVGCLDFIDSLARGRSRAPAAPAEKPSRLSADEVAAWLRAFDGLADDPAFTELFDPFGFADEDS